MVYMVDNREFERFIYRAWTRDGKNIYTGEALLIALLMHTHADDRKSDAMGSVKKLMKDHNL